MASVPPGLAASVPSGLKVVIRHPRLQRIVPWFWPLSRQSLPAWASFVAVVLSSFLRYIVLRRRDATGKVYAQKREHILQLMEVMLQYVQERKAATKIAGGDQVGREAVEVLPEAKKILSLLWDDIYDVRTTYFGIAPGDERNVRVEALLQRATNQELERVTSMTRRSIKHRRAVQESGTVDDGDTAAPQSLREAQELARHWNGERLHEQLSFTLNEVQKKMGRRFVDEEQVSRAQVLLRSIRHRQQRHIAELLGMLAPVFPLALITTGLQLCQDTMAAVFHQIGYWTTVVDGAVAGDWAYSRHQMVRLYIGHLLFDWFGLLAGTSMTCTKNRMNSILKCGIVKAMMRQDYEYFDRHSPGELQNRLNRDSQKMMLLLSLPIDTISTVYKLCCNMYGAYIVCPPKLFWPSVLPLVPAILWQHFLSEHLVKIRNVQRRIIEEEQGKSFEVLREMKTVRQFAMESRAAAAHTRGLQVQQEFNEIASFKEHALNLLFWIPTYLGLLVTVIVGAHMVVDGTVKLSTLFDVQAKLNFNVVFPMRMLLDSLKEIKDLRINMIRICDLLQSNPGIEETPDLKRIPVSGSEDLRSLLGDCEVVADGAFLDSRLVAARDLGRSSVRKGDQLVSVVVQGAEVMVLGMASVDPGSLRYPVQACFSEKVRPPRLHGKIEFDNVDFAYPTCPGKPVLRGMSFTVEPGQKVALVGSTGCGKSSIMSLLLRLYQPQAGTIKIDGRPIEDYDIHFLRSRMVIVDQHTVLFEMTLRRNITYGLDALVDVREIEEVCRKACAWDFIAEKTDKLMTDVQAGGSNLSGGERQRIAIARAMVRKPDMILLDEATSALDGQSEAVVQEGLDRLAREGSALVIAHRLSTIKDSDSIIVMNSGKSTEVGRHDALLQGAAESDSVAGGSTQLRSRHGRSQTVPGAAARGCRAPRRSGRSAPRPSTRQEQPGPSRTTYKRLWDAAHRPGEDAAMTVNQMKVKLNKLRAERSKWEASAARIRRHMADAALGPGAG